jgi:hypothetical protein
VRERVILIGLLSAVLLLAGCGRPSAEQALGEMKSDGTLKELEQKHLQQYLDVPALEK